MWFEKLKNRIKDFFVSYDTEEIIMGSFLFFIMILVFVALIGLFVSLINCTV